VLALGLAVETTLVLSSAVTKREAIVTGSVRFCDNWDATSSVCRIVGLPVPAGRVRLELQDQSRAYVVTTAMNGTFSANVVAGHYVIEMESVRAADQRVAVYDWPIGTKSFAIMAGQHIVLDLLAVSLDQ